MSPADWLYARSAVRIAEKRLGVRPEVSEAEVLRAKPKLGILNCTRP